MTTLRAQNALRKVAFDWGKAGKHGAYIAGGTGAGLLTNALLGNKSLLSYILSGGLGAGAGLGTEALVDYIRRKRGEKTGSKRTDGGIETAQGTYYPEMLNEEQELSEASMRAEAAKAAQKEKAKPKKEEKKATPKQMYEAAARMYGSYSPEVLANGGKLPEAPLSKAIRNSLGTPGPVLSQGSTEKKRQK